MSDDEILREAARLILKGYPPDAFIQRFEKFPPAFRVQNKDGKFSNGGRHWNFGANGKRYSKVAHIKTSIPAWTQPEKEKSYDRYHDCKRRIEGGFVVETVEIPIRKFPISEILEEKERLGKQKFGR